jgi:DNA-binding MarR family transcriptional regulator
VVATGIVGVMGLDAAETGILKAMAPAGTAYRTLPDLHELTGLSVGELAGRLARLERRGYVAARRDGMTGADRSYGLTPAGQTYADAHTG